MDYSKAIDKILENATPQDFTERAGGFSTGKASGFSGAEGEAASDFIRFIEGDHEAQRWEDLSAADRRKFAKWLPKES
jgi:hypothetical protein